jgi:hypothetical protein
MFTALMATFTLIMAGCFQSEYKNERSDPPPSGATYQPSPSQTYQPYTSPGYSPYPYQTVHPSYSPIVSTSASPSTNPTPSNPGDGVVQFFIPPGTQAQDWNTQETMVVVRVGQTLRVTNNDSVVHAIHTNGRPFPHGADIQPGGTGTYVIRQTFEPGQSPLYCHHFNGKFWLRATN